MTLAIRSYSQIAAQMTAELAALLRDRLTDFTEGGVARSLLEVSADELQRLEVSLFQGVRDGMAAGTFRTFDFGKAVATHAAGTVRFSRAIAGPPISIPLGQQVAVPGNGERTYATVVEATLTGVAVDVPVQCVNTGRVGNTAAHTVVLIIGGIIGVDSVDNLAPFLNGLDQESDEDRLLRFRLYIAGLSRATRVALEGAALGVTRYEFGEPVERVTGVYVFEPFLETPPAGLHGLVIVYIDNGSGTASQGLVDLTLQVLRGYRDPMTGARIPGWVAAGIDLQVRAVTAVAVNVVAQVTVQSGVDPVAVRASVQVAIEEYLLSLQVFQAAVYTELVTAAMNVDGVTDVVFTTPLANTPTAFNQRIIPGVVAIS